MNDVRCSVGSLMDKVLLPVMAKKLAYLCVLVWKGEVVAMTTTSNTCVSLWWIVGVCGHSGRLCSCWQLCQRDKVFRDGRGGRGW